ncbi:MAG: hypothetical protein WDA25_01015 [Paracoccaceae bacterium]
MAIKFRLAMGASPSTMAIVEGDTLPGGNAVAVNFDFDGRMGKSQAVRLVRAVKRQIIRGDWPAGEAVPDPDPDPEPEPGDIALLNQRVALDAGWSWHIVEQAVYDSVRDRIYKGAVSIKPETGDAGAQWVLEFDGSTGAYLTRHLVNTGYIADDHNAPAVVIHDGRLIVGVAGHNDQSAIKMGWSTDTNPANLGEFVTLPTTSAATYVQFIVIGSSIYAFCRSGSYRWAGWQNTAGGDPAAWGSAVTMMDSEAQSYQAARSTGAAWAAILWDHPTQDNPNRGKIMVAEKGNPLAAPAVDINQAPVLYTPEPGTSARVLSVNEDCTQFLYGVFAIGAEGAAAPYAYHLARLTGTDRLNPADWTHEALDVSANSAFYDVSAYFAGGELVGSGADATTLWLTYDAQDLVYTLAHWTRPNAATPWVKTALGDSTLRLARPVAVRGMAGAAMVQSFGSRYLGYTNFDIDAFTAMGTDPANYAFFPNVRNPPAVMSDYDTFDETDGTLLANHTPNIGGPWIEPVGEMTIASQRLYSSGTSVALIDENLPQDIAIYAYMFGRTISGGGYLVLRSDDEAQNFIQFGYNANGPDGGGFYLYEFVGGSATVLASHVMAWRSGTYKVLMLIAEGQTMRGLVDGVEVVSATLTAPYAPGKGGVRLVGGSASTRFHVQSFGIGVLAA